jgi:predicted HTH transcriptional regulator
MESHSNKEGLIEFILDSKVVTTSEIASVFKISWNTAEKYLLELALDQKVVRLKKHGVNLWIRKFVSKEVSIKGKWSKILQFALESQVVTTSEIASKFKISWNTAEKYLLELTLEGKISRLKKQGVNLWIVK